MFVLDVVITATEGKGNRHVGCLFVCLLACLFVAVNAVVSCCIHAIVAGMKKKKEERVKQMSTQIVCVRGWCRLTRRIHVA